MKTLETLVRTFVEGHPQDAAKALAQVDAAEAVKIVEILPSRLAGLLMERLTPQKAGTVLDLLAPDRTQELLAGMSPRQASLVLQHLEPAKREEALVGLPDAKARELRELMHYPPETAGGMMEPRVASIPMDLNVQSAIGVLRKAPRQTLFYLYVTDQDGRLVGVLNMRNLLLASPRDTIESLMSNEIMSVPGTMDREDVLILMRRHRFLALPVVDADGRLIGVIKHDEALRAGQLEAFEDLQKMVGAGGDERAISPVSTVVKRRLPWLYVNLVTAFAAAATVGLFEGVIQKVTALAV
jgi:magnesium transporter